MIHEATIRACVAIRLLLKQGYAFEPAGECVRFTQVPGSDSYVPYVCAANILAEDNPCRYVRRALRGDARRI